MSTPFQEMENGQTNEYIIRDYIELTAVEGTYAANAGMANSISVDISKTGYTAIGVVGLFGQGSGVGNFCPTLYAVDIANQTLAFYGKNTASSNITVTKYYAYILYVKNS